MSSTNGVWPSAWPVPAPAFRILPFLATESREIIGRGPAPRLARNPQSRLYRDRRDRIRSSGIAIPFPIPIRLRAMATNRQRKKLFIDPAVQGALLRRLMLHWIYVMIALFSCLLIGQILSTGTEYSLGTYLALMWQKYGMLFVVMLCLFPAFAYDSVKLSNRFAGPMFSLATGVAEAGSRRGHSAAEISPRRFLDGDCCGRQPRGRTAA